MIIGMLATDVGYANIHGEINDAVKYYQTIQRLSDEINLPETDSKFDIRQIIENKNNLDSLL